MALKTPDITLAQILAALGWLATQGVTTGVVDNDQSALILQIGSTVVSAAWVIGDALIRNGRSKAVAAANTPAPPA